MSAGRWFHADLSGAEAEQLLLTKGVDGSFLARDSKSQPGDYSLSVRRDGKVTHIKIQNTGDFYDLGGGEKFASLTELIQYYMENPDQLKEKSGRQIALKFTLFADVPTSERWFHGALSGPDAQALLLETSSKIGSFLVRNSQSTLGDYALSVRANDGVTHVIIKCKNGRYDINGGDQFSSLLELIEHYRRNPMVDTSGQVVHLKFPINSTRVAACSIDDRVAQLGKEHDAAGSGKGGFWDEFESLQQQESKYLYSRKEGQKPENRGKNRYRNIVPFDHTRVVLQCEDEANPGADYINANWIRVLPDYEEFAGITKTYISTQGCLATTVDDFWRLVWQENVRVLVMMTKETERHKTKCVRYWPDSGETKKYGSRKEFSLSSLEETQTNDFILRKFILLKSDDKSGDERLIFHWQFQAWPDHGVPTDPSCVLNFLDQVNLCQEMLPPPTTVNHSAQQPATTSKHPLLVHCSAGIGRTGTYIVIDLILSLIKRMGLSCDVDIHRTVQMVRTQRSGMVQTEAQYKFVYLAVQHYIDTRRRSKGDGVLTERQTHSHYYNTVSGKAPPPDVAFAVGDHDHSVRSNGDANSLPMSQPRSSVHPNITDEIPPQPLQPPPLPRRPAACKQPPGSVNGQAQATA